MATNCEQMFNTSVHHELTNIQVPEDSAEKNKKAFVDFKRVVWHESFYKLVESIWLHSKTGCWILCGDGVKHHLFPAIIILSADFEEQYVFNYERIVF